MRAVVLASLVVSASLGVSQTKPSKASMAYHAARQEITKPAYSLAKIEAMIKGLKEDSDDYSKKISQATWDKLTANEKFTYTMIHGEDTQQNCDAFFAMKDEEKKIFGHLPSAFNNETWWSERQVKWMTANRTFVIDQIRDTVKTRKHIGSNLKGTIYQLAAWELIPNLKAWAAMMPTDHDIISTMSTLMYEAEFKPFTSSKVAEQMRTWKDDMYPSVPATAQNRKAIIDYALAYYASKKTAAAKN